MGCLRTLVLTGGPGGGKSRLLKLLEKELGTQVQIIPEVATVLFSQLLPLPDSDAERRIVQSAIYWAQAAAESLQRARRAKNKILVLDRGLLDGAAYWPGGADAFLEHFNVNEEQLRDGYDAVVHMETAAKGGHTIACNNWVRQERGERAIALDERLFALWSPHRHFALVPHASSFDDKLRSGLGAVKGMLKM